VQYKSLLAILEFTASLAYSAQAKDFVFRYRKLLQPRSLYGGAPQVTLLPNFSSYQYYQEYFMIVTIIVTCKLVSCQGSYLYSRLLFAAISCADTSWALILILWVMALW